MPDQQLAGNATAVSGRQQRELELVDRIESWRTSDPKRFMRACRMLALIEAARSRETE